jgi:FKBP-type peptidyl-prolyl cis-trans isomerase 2
MFRDPALVPGARVLLPAEPEWGEGQVQSVIGQRATVNFAHAGKRVIELGRARLEVLPDDD